MTIQRPLTTREQAEADRSRDEVKAAALAAALLWGHRESLAIAAAASVPIGELINRVRRSAAGSIGEIRGSAAAQGTESVRRQLPTLTVAAPAIAAIAGLHIVGVTTRRYAIDWGAALRSWLGQGAPKATAAELATRQLQGRAAGIAGTEASQTYNGARRTAARAASRGTGLVALERWVTEFGPNTCHRCEFADGETIRLGDDFAEGIPGAVHPRCHCTSIYLYEDPATAWLLTS